MEGKIVMKNNWVVSVMGNSTKYKDYNQLIILDTFVAFLGFILKATVTRQHSPIYQVKT